MAESKTKTLKSERTLNLILDASLQCYEEHGISNTSLEMVAKAAGVGRTTLYRYASNKENLLEMVLERDQGLIQDELETIVKYHDDLGAAIVDSFLFNIRGRRTRPINKLLFDDKHHMVINRLSLNPEDYLESARNLLGPLYEREHQRGRIREGVTLDMLAEMITRLLISYFNDLGETGQDEKSLRRLLETLVVPAIIKPDPAA